MSDNKNIILDSKIRKAFAEHRWEDLVRLTKQALRKNLHNQLAHRLLGFSFSKIKNYQAAEDSYKRAVKIHPQDSELLVNFANFYIEIARNDAAFPILEKLVILNPESSVIWQKMAQACYALGFNQKGFDASECALQHAKDVAEHASALVQRAIHRRELGQVQAAVEDCEEVIRIAPHDPASYTNRMLFLLADPEATMQQLKSAAEDFAKVFEMNEKELWVEFSDRDKTPVKKLKIGFLSPDLRDHPVMYFSEGVLAQLDRRQFEVHAFYLYPKEDAITERVKKHADYFYSWSSITDKQRAEKIRELGIDILIEMAGHTGYNGLGVMLYKPAPIQLTWLGFPATTGLKSIDYKISDDVTDPDGAEKFYTEKIYRLPTLFCCYRPLIREPLWRYQPDYQVKPAPVLENDYITFGSCNNLGKLTDEVLTLWGELLDQVPGSRLLIEGKNLGNEDAAANYRERCEKLGIDIGRLILVPLSRYNQYLTYHKIDIALDPFPLTGGTTTFDLLWMGVPLVSMIGDSFKSRMGTGILTFLGHEEWLAKNKLEYLEIAKKMASDVETLNKTRLQQRQKMERSVLMNEDVFVHYFGEGLRAMWLEWVARQQSTHHDEHLHLIQRWAEDVAGEWSESAVKQVGWMPGQRIQLSEAHDLILKSIELAKKSTQNDDLLSSGRIKSKRWMDVVENAEKILAAVPGDPVALSCLAEVEHVHGHTEFAVTYLKYATESMK